MNNQVPTNFTLNPAKRISAFTERMRSELKINTLNTFEDEKTYLNKLEITEQNIFKIIEHKEDAYKNELDAKDKLIEDMKNSLNELTDISDELRKYIIELDGRSVELTNELNRINEYRSKTLAEIIKLRKDNTKAFDLQLSNKHKDEIDIKALKSELCMILNMLKLRILNIDSNDPVYVGYINNINDNTLLYISIDKKLDNLSKGKMYWNAMNELIVKKNLSNSLN